MSGVDIAGLVEELRSLADCDARSGEPLGRCMRRAADVIERGHEHTEYIEAQWLAKDAALKSATRQRDEALAALKASEDALKPFAAIDSRLGGRHAFDEWVAGSVVFGIGSDRVITVGDLRRARSALENSKARLADAKNDPADSDLSSLREGDGTTYPRLSSLRKDAVGPAVSEGDRGHGAPVTSGAEVAGWRPMSTAPKDGTRIDVWVRSTEQTVKEYRHCGAYWNAVQGEWQLGSYHVGQFEHRPEVTHWMPIPERPIDAALVSGSREDGDAPASEESP